MSDNLETMRDAQLQRLANLREQAESDEWLAGELNKLDDITQRMETGNAIDFMQRTIDWLELVLEHKSK